MLLLILRPYNLFPSVYFNKGPPPLLEVPIIMNTGRNSCYCCHLVVRNRSHAQYVKRHSTTSVVCAVKRSDRLNIHERTRSTFRCNLNIITDKSPIQHPSIKTFVQGISDVTLRSCNPYSSTQTTVKPLAASFELLLTLAGDLQKWYDRSFGFICSRWLSHRFIMLTITESLVEFAEESKQ